MKALIKSVSLKKIVKPDDQITQQFILQSKVLLGGLDKRYSSDERIQMLMQAIQMTIPNFRLSKIEDYLYTLDEMKLVNQIGNAYSLAGDNEKSSRYFLSVASVYETPSPRNGHIKQDASFGSLQFCQISGLVGKI